MEESYPSPCKATSQQADITVSKVCNVAYNNGYSSVTIYNLFPYRGTNPTDLINFFNDSNYVTEMRKNLGIITLILIIKMWFMHGELIQSLLKKLFNKNMMTLSMDLISVITPSNVFNARIKRSPYPLHGQRWSHNDKLV